MICGEDMNKLEQYKDFYNKKLGAKEKILKDLDSCTKQLKITNRELKRKEKALELVKLAAINTQKELEFHISSIVSTALSAVFDDPYEFQIDFVDRRGKTECDLWFVKKRNRLHPLSSAGIGAANIAAFALRIASLSMSKHLRQTLIMDEPFPQLRGEEHNQKAIQMVNTVSKELVIQIITVSDERAVLGDIISGADKIFKVNQKNDVSNIEEII